MVDGPSSHYPVAAPDHLTEAGAHKAAARIVAYWAAKGHHNVRAWVEPVSLESGAARKWNQRGTYVIRSNLVNAWPPS